MSKCHKELITCPNCKETGDYICWDSINVDLDPDAKEKVKNGELFQYTCSNCKKSYNIEYQTLYHDMKNKFMVQYLPNPTEKNFEDFLKELNQIKGMNKKYNLNFNEKVRITKDRNEFVEKIIIFESGLEDIYIELTKLVIISQFNKTHPNEKMPKIYFTKLNSENIYFSTYDGRSLNTERTLFDSILNDYEIIIPEDELIQVDIYNVMDYVKEK